MAIPTTDLDIGTRYALQEDFNNGFVGRDRQVVIQTDDPKGYRPVIMDGVTQGGKSKVALLADLSDYVSVSTYNSDKAGFETTTHASATYATKSELTSGLAGKADSSALASYATKTELNSYATLAAPALTGNATLDGSPIATEADIDELQTQISDRYNNYGVLPEDASQNTYATVQQLQSTTTNLSDYVGAQGQLVFNTDTKHLHLMDGSTVGGTQVANSSDIPVLTSSTTDLEAGTSPLATGTYYFVYE